MGISRKLKRQSCATNGICILADCAKPRFRDTDACQLKNWSHEPCNEVRLIQRCDLYTNFPNKKWLNIWMCDLYNSATYSPENTVLWILQWVFEEVVWQRGWVVADDTRVSVLRPHQRRSASVNIVEIKMVQSNLDVKKSVKFGIYFVTLKFLYIEIQG